MFGVGVGVRVGGTASGFGVAPYVGLLDDYPSAAAAYSVRLLRSGYTGNAIRVRRSSDNAEQDIYFDANGNLDTAQLTSFCSGTNGFVTTWYDQSGNGKNALNTTAANQPQIVSSGSIITQNSKPIIKFGITNELILNIINVDVSDSSFFLTYKKSSTGDNVVFINTGSSYLHLDYGNDQYYGNIQNSIPSFNTTNYMLKSASMTYGSSLKWYKDNSLLLERTSSFTGGQQVSKLFGTAFSRIESFSSEIIIYASSQSANVNGINTNINNYYGIY